MHSRKLVLFYCLLVAVYFADIISKDLAFEALEWDYRLAAADQPIPPKNIPVIGQILSFEAGLNTGISFSLLENNNTVLGWVMIFAIGLILLVAHLMKEKPLIVYCALACIIGGALGNLYDRLSYSGVRDFIKFPRFPIFNVADSAISVGAGLIIIYLIFEEKFKQSIAEAAETSDAQSATSPALTGGEDPSAQPAESGKQIPKES